eukprot:gb/GEZN01010764.1/.p2 GENE.gb/GEZN01010764.1/~~gb/GEZN01010764.1/.p2  ORF type:complete len:138 (-),score=27.57 gb/GEZN01010764.1/:52-465(-)
MPSDAVKFAVQVPLLVAAFFGGTSSSHDLPEVERLCVDFAKSMIAVLLWWRPVPHEQSEDKSDEGEHESASGSEVSGEDSMPMATASAAAKKKQSKKRRNKHTSNKSKHGGPRVPGSEPELAKFGGGEQSEDENVEF